MPHRVGEALALGFRGTSVPAWLREFEARHGLGGVILFDQSIRPRTPGRNITSPPQVKALCTELAALPSRPLVLVDQEGGRVRRLKESLGFAPLPSAQAFAALGPEERLRLARASLEELAALGIHYDLAPVVDLDYNPANPDIGAHGRSYSADPAVARACVEAMDTAARAANVGLCLKHYPGLGGATVNSHEQVTDLSDTIRDEQLELFYDLGGRVHGTAILVSHGHVKQWDPVLPATLSPAILGALRERLPDVLLISDDVQMQGLQRTHSTADALRQGLAAGLDLLIVGNNLVDEEQTSLALAESLQQAVAGDPRLAERLREASDRVQSRKRLLRR